ncbi:MAG: hypothetical protein CSA70_07235 [Rhodobacterales bacterium]|nr:MAG: hypothetical protein CSA70_07235 [Rhodobacterales bacterium]
MRAALSMAALAAIAVVVWWLWGAGGVHDLRGWATEGQREAQNAMAGMLRRLRAGEAGALIGLWAVCFSYGFFHAAGPGHGKLLIGGYGVARRVAMRRLAGLAVASSLAQAATAVVLVYAGVFALNLTRTAMVGMAEDWLAPASYIAIAMVGGWLALRGAGKLWRARVAGQGHHGHAHGHDHGHGHDHDPGHHGGHMAHHTHDDGTCSCGHTHGPTPEEAAAISTWREAAVLVASIAIRPCTGAVFLLILTWRMGIEMAGIAGAFVMGLGTASVTVVVALLSVVMRESAWAGRVQGTGAARLASLMELGVGVVIAVVAMQLALGGI